MANVFDVAHYILKQAGAMSAMKLQKLVYYSQAWSLVWDEVPLFNEKIEAWSNGPVVRDLYNVHRGQYEVSAPMIAPRAKGQLNQDQRETVDVVLKAYGKKTAQWLSSQTHCEPPWKDARKGMSDSTRGSREISQDAIKRYYSSLS